MKKRILIYAHYYAPDVASTGQILQDLAEGMKDEFDVTVICTVPSYTGSIPEKYRKKQIYEENINGVHVVRVPVPRFSKTSKLSRIRNLLSYCIEAQKATKKVGPHDFIFTISQPPILGGLLGVYGKKHTTTKTGKRPKLIYNIQDFNPEQIEAVGYFKNKLILNFLRRLDNWTCYNSDLVVTVGRDLVETLKKRFKGEKIPNHIMINNWIDENQIYPLPMEHPKVAAFRENYGLTGKFVFMYSGNIGLYYDLEGLMSVIEHFRSAKTTDGREVAFAFVGDGSVLQKLKDYQHIHDMKNVVFIPYQKKDELIYSLNAADVHWCVNAKGIKGVSCPSKFYGIIAVGKPVLSVLDSNSEIGMLMNESVCGKCSEPEAYEMVEKNIQWFIDNANSSEMLELGKRGNQYLKRHLSKKASIDKYKQAILHLK